MLSKSLAHSALSSYLVSILGSLKSAMISRQKFEDTGWVFEHYFVEIKLFWNKVWKKSDKKICLWDYTEQKCSFRDVFFHRNIPSWHTIMLKTAINGPGSLRINSREELFYTHNIPCYFLSSPICLKVSDFTKCLTHRRINQIHLRKTRSESIANQSRKNRSI